VSAAPERPPYLVVAGPTAVGKSAVALDLAVDLDGEIVVADSRQVYRGLDIGTAKPGPEERQRVRHHLLDAIDLGERYTAADWARAATDAIGDIQRRGRTAIVSGGTGFYLAALAGALDPLEGQFDDAGRARARARVAEIPDADRHAALARVDPVTADRLHPRDRQRIERALEVWFQLGRPLSALQSGGAARGLHVAVRLARPRAELHARISARFERMLERGLEDEARRLWERGLDPDRTAGLDTIGYQEWWPFFNRRRGRSATCAAIVRATRAYARRQETWFRHQGDYVEVSAAGAAEAVRDVWRRATGARGRAASRART